MVLFTIWKQEPQGQWNVAVASLSSLTDSPLILLKTDDLWVSSTQTEYKNILWFKNTYSWWCFFAEEAVYSYILESERMLVLYYLLLLLRHLTLLFLHFFPLSLWYSIPSSIELKYFSRLMLLLFLHLVGFWLWSGFLKANHLMWPCVNWPA